MSSFDADVVVIGGGPAGSVLSSLLSAEGWRVLVLEREVHPREHIGESLTPASNAVWERIGFRSKIEDAGFVHKPGAAWTSPQSPAGKHVTIRLAELPTPGTLPPYYTYNVERDVFDAMLLRHAAERGAKVLAGVRAARVLFDEHERATGVRAVVADGWERDVRARFVVDASGRRCLLANQLGLRGKDPDFNQFAVYSWFRGVQPNPPGTEGMILLHFVGWERAWVWQIPLRGGITSVGVVADKRDFKASGQDAGEWFAEVIKRNASLRQYMRHAEPVRPYRIEGDYSYKIAQLCGKGWLLLGDAVRFVDPIFSTGIDVAAFSALYAAQAIGGALRGEDERLLMRDWETKVTAGIDVWYELISLFYRLQNLFTFFAVKPSTRDSVVRILQGNPYSPDTLPAARVMIERMKLAQARLTAEPGRHLFGDGRLTIPGAVPVRAKT